LKTKGIYSLYRVLQIFALPLLLLYFVYRSLWDRGYFQSLPQRFGFLSRSFKQTGPGAIWLHAVSVGEVSSCVEFLRQIRTEFPNSGVFVSAGTVAGRAIAAEQLRGLVNGVFFAPVDYVFAVRRVLRALQPSVVVIAETEIWPNLFREAKRTGAALAVVNGRISDRAYPRYLSYAWFFRAVLPAVDTILAQSGEIRDRFLALGAPPERVRAAGNFKFDFEARTLDAASPLRAFLERVRPAKVWIAASTMPPAAEGDVDEHRVVLDAFKELAQRYPSLLLILAPRKTTSFTAVAQQLAPEGLPHVLRSKLQPGDTLELPGVLLLDSIGELSGLFSAADAVFMGGTLADRGGHNILEPALFGKPVIIGPHMENFQAIAQDFRAAGACIEIREASELVRAVERLLDAPDTAHDIGQRALTAAQAQRGASARAVAELRKLYLTHLPSHRPAMPWFAAAWLLSGVWLWGGKRRQTRNLKRRRKLEIPVISVGNLTMGGTGKTPCVLRVAEDLKAAGAAPGILTRGYGRVSLDKLLVAAPGETLPTEQLGDEPQIFVRSGVAPVGIGADRYETGLLLRKRFGVDTLVLDDGFQHVRLARNADIVLIDALNPFGGGNVFPLGRLREPPRAIVRADLILITRSQFSDLGATIEHAVRQWNPHAPIFRARVEPRAWVENRTRQTYPLINPPFTTVAAFCGLGNPQSFRRTLSRIGIEPVDWIEFDDHHRYRPHELKHMAEQFRGKGASALVTTEKDSVNLCDSCDELLAPLPLYWLRVAMTIDREREFLAELDRLLH
jgi:3-deoxy-D-manno-octulosonic-acid transferase